MSTNKRKIQEINAGSMADIAFLLLIFFLVATTMNVDTGIARVLPPYVDPTEQQDAQVRERDLMTVLVNPSGQIMVSGEILPLAMLKDKVKEFIANPTDDENLPGKDNTEIEMIGTYPVSRAIISLQTERSTNYRTYISVQNELTRALNELRDEASRSIFGRGFADLTEDQRGAIEKAVKSSISEAEPKNTGR